MNRFSSMAGGVKVCFVKLDGGVMFGFYFMEACNVDIATGCTASRNCTMAVAKSAHGLDARGIG